MATTKRRRQGRRGLSPEDRREQAEIIGSELEDVFRNLRNRSPVHNQVFAAEHSAARGLMVGDCAAAGLLAEALQSPALGLDPSALFFDVGHVERLSEMGSDHDR